MTSPARKYLNGMLRATAGMPPMVNHCITSLCPSQRMPIDVAVQLASYKFEVNYATGSVVGQVGHDTVSVGTPAVTVSSQGIGLATDSTSDFLSTSCDGLWVWPCQEFLAADVLSCQLLLLLLLVVPL